MKYSKIRRLHISIFIFNETSILTRGVLARLAFNLFLKNQWNHLTIDKDNGFVGIGTLNPTEKLNIHHNLKQNVEIQGQLKGSQCT